MKTVSIVINVYNQARFLRESIESALSQTIKADQVIVVDDGSTDAPDVIVGEFEDIRYLRKENGGLSSSRNTGLSLSTSDYIVFLDADDRLVPMAVEAGLNAFESNPDAWLVYGAYRVIDIAGTATSPIWHSSVGKNPAIQFLRNGNFIAMHGTVMFDKARMVELGGYDETLSCCEDLDLYIRIAKQGKIVSHDAFVAEYRHHPDNMSRNRRRMLNTVQRVIKRHATDLGSSDAMEAAQDGVKLQKLDYAVPMVREAAAHIVRNGLSRDKIADIAVGIRTARFMIVGATISWAVRRFWATKAGNAMRSSLGIKTVPKGHFDFGDFCSTLPASRSFGFDRGTPVDRHYIDTFLQRNSGLISGHVLEVGDRNYTIRFGCERVTRSDVVHIDPNFVDANYHGDLSVESTLPTETFDCIIITQTLHLIYDMELVVRNLHRALKPGGVLLVTSPGLSPVDRAEWASTWYWSVTQHGLRQLMLSAFKKSDINIIQYGNVFSAMAFLQGLAVEELPSGKLDFSDPSMPVIVAAIAKRGTDGTSG